MVSITSWMYVIIPGFVYLVAFSFFFLWISKTYTIHIPEGSSAYLPYIAIVILFASFVIGLACNLALEEIFYWNQHPNDAVSSLLKNQNVQARYIDQLANVYSGLLLMRHLMISVLLLVVALFLWIRKGKFHNLKLRLLVPLMLFEIPLYLAYLFQRDQLNQLVGAP